MARISVSISALLLAASAIIAVSAVQLRAEGDDARMSARVDELIRWIGRNSDLDVSNVTPPKIEYRSRAEMAAMMHLGPSDTANWPLALEGADTLYLQSDFRLGFDDWMLLHELVHHVQRATETSYPCPELAERVAYELQVRFAHERGGRIPSDLFVRLLTCPD